MTATDFATGLREAIREARAAGLTEAADELEARVSAPSTTSSEMLGEAGLAIRRFLARGGDGVPAGVRRRLDRCLDEVGRVWPDLGRKRL